MFESNIGRFAQDVASLLLMRGTSLPPLQWQSQQHRAAKKTLDEYDDAKLFGRENLVSEAMGAAVRALLYLWNGWIGDCNMYGQVAEPKERLYLMGLCERQLGRADDAKKIFRQLDGHSLYAVLGADAVELAGSRTHPAAKRFREIIQLDGTWEPFAFVDLYQQAATGNVDAGCEEMVRQLQCREFERLLVHCYQGATGEALTVSPAGAASRPPKAPVRRPVTSTRQAKRPPLRETSKEDTRATCDEKAPTRPISPTAPVRVACPKCGQVALFPASMLGKVVRCQKCNACFEIPRVAVLAGRR